VTFAGWRGGFGNLVIVENGDTEYYYAHASSLVQEVGDASSRAGARPRGLHRQHHRPAPPLRDPRRRNADRPPPHPRIARLGADGNGLLAACASSSSVTSTRNPASSGASCARPTSPTRRLAHRRLTGDDDVRLVLLGDLVHAKSRERYADLTEVRRYDEHNPRHLRKAEAAQEAFLREVMAFQAALPPVA
jgi:hypothetical protein